jgi:hypothetical protein
MYSMRYLIVISALGCGVQAEAPADRQQLPAAGSAASSKPVTPTAPASVIPPLPPPTIPFMNPAVPPDTSQACTSTSVSAAAPANLPVDLIWVVDASGSMDDEQLRIAANLGEFADRIVHANLDAHIVMVTRSDLCGGSHDPLAASPLANSPRYQFIDHNVGSHDALEVAVEQYASYAGFLRATAKTHLIVVSDDESRYHGKNTPPERAAAFLADMRALLDHDFTLHAIASEGPEACRNTQCVQPVAVSDCKDAPSDCRASAPGDTYYELARLTGGLSESICKSDWRTIFDPLTASVIASAPLPCDIRIPAPPAQQTLDPSKVNVQWSAPGSSSGTSLRKAANAAACLDELGWYYDEPARPQQVMLCPKACNTVVASGGTLSFGFGCDTLELK